MLELTVLVDQSACSTLLLGASPQDELLRIQEEGPAVSKSSELWADKKDPHKPLRSSNSKKPPWIPDAVHKKNQVSPSSAAAGRLLDNELLTLCQRGHLDKALHVLSHIDPSSPPSRHAYVSLLKACNKQKSLHHVKHVHAHFAHHNVRLTGLLGDYLVVTLAKCGDIEDARSIHHALPLRTVFSWTAIISAYVECGQGREALHMHKCMLEDGVEPDHFTFVSLFRACGSIPELTEGRKLHDNARMKGFDSDVFVGASLVTMYGKCGSIMEAENAFCELPCRDIVCWSAMLSAYVEQGQGEKALQVYRQMQEEGVSADAQAYASALQACETLAEKEEPVLIEGLGVKLMSLEIVQALHADARRKRFSSNVFVGTSLVSMYGKLGTIVDAENVFMGLSERNVASWTVMLSAYVEQNQGEKALQSYKQMHEEGMSPDQQTFVNSLQACGTLADEEKIVGAAGLCVKLICMEIGQALHADAHRKGLSSDVFVGTSLISMYGKYGAITEAEDVFDRLSQHDIVSWTAMLSSYVEQGEGEKALHLYRQMQRDCVTLTDVTLLCILQACSETGSLETCRRLHFTIVSAEYDQNLSLGNTLIHAYGSCASMVDAQSVFDGLDQRDPVSWTACIAGYAGDGNCAACLEMFDKMLIANVKPDAMTFASILSACSHDGLVVKGVGYFESMRRAYGVAPDVKHYASIVDLVGRAGDFKRLENIFGGMSIQPDLTFWLCLLGACRMHGDMDIGRRAFHGAVTVQPRDGAAYILMSNIYANAGLQECTEEVENSRQKLCIEEGLQEVDQAYAGSALF